MGKRILVIDDDSMNLRLAEKSLLKGGHTVYQAASGEEGLQLLEKEAVDLVLLDMEMPGMNGTETLRRIREKEGWRTLPVAILSADEEAMDILKENGLQADGFIKKPFLPPALLGQVEEILG